MHIVGKTVETMIQLLPTLQQDGLIGKKKETENISVPVSDRVQREDMAV